MTRQQFEGCLLGLALGDALGAPYEGGVLERLAWRLIGKTGDGKMRWTDDTQMSLDLAESLVDNGRVDPDDLARRFAASYRWSRGYGPGAAKILKRIASGTDWLTASRSVYPEGSYGNGAAMRAPLIGLFYATRPEQLAEANRLAAIVTHAHPLGIEGARLIALATAQALSSDNPRDILAAAATTVTSTPYAERIAVARKWFEAGVQPRPTEVNHQLGNGIAATESTVSALYIALRFIDNPFVTMLDFIRRCGGDVDTIGAMAGAIWGAANGSDGLPQDSLQKLEQQQRLQTVAGELYASKPV